MCGSAVGQARPSVAHPDAVRPYQDVRAADPSDPAALALAGHRLAVQPTDHRVLVQRTRARIRAHGHDHADRPSRGGVAHGRAPHRDARGGGHRDVGHDRNRSGPGRQLRDTDRRILDGDVWHDRGARTPPPPTGLRPPGVPQLARARPPAARHTGRAALPSATFPHSLPADCQIRGPSDATQYCGGGATGGTRHV